LKHFISDHRFQNDDYRLIAQIIILDINNHNLIPTLLQSNRQLLATLFSNPIRFQIDFLNLLVQFPDYKISAFFRNPITSELEFLDIRGIRDPVGKDLQISVSEIKILDA
jgi:hypothetical protein